MEPPSFPNTPGELEEWSVYADFLMTRGDRRGELIAHELAVQEPADMADVRALQELARPLCRQGRTTAFGYCLGHMRTIAVHWGGSMMRRRYSPDTGTLARVRDLLRTVPASRVEAVSLPVVPGENPWHVRQLLGALPASCRRVELVLGAAWTEAQLDDVIGLLPDHVRELALRGDSPFEWTDAIYGAISDRFEVVELPSELSSRRLIDAGDHARRIAAAVAATERVRVRLAQWGMAWPHARCELGRPGDAALVRDDRPYGAVLARWSLITQQWNYNLVPVRTQLAGSLPEGYQIAIGRDQMRLSVVQTRYGAYLVRRGERWTVRGPDDRPVAVGEADRVLVANASWRLMPAAAATRLLRGQPPDLHGASDQ